MSYNLNDYEPVEERLKKYADDHPNYRVETDVIGNTEDYTTIIIKASLFKNAEDIQPHATGIAEETKGGPAVNRTSHVENCETSAIGRALANANYSGSKRPSREEMEKVERHQEPEVDEWPNTKQCPVHAGQTLYRRDGKDGGYFYSHKLGDGWCNGR